jgi:hypothetical protein
MNTIKFRYHVISCSLLKVISLLIANLRHMKPVHALAPDFHKTRLMLFLLNRQVFQMTSSFMVLRNQKSSYDKKNECCPEFFMLCLFS